MPDPIPTDAELAETFRQKLRDAEAAANDLTKRGYEVEIQERFQPNAEGVSYVGEIIRKTKL